MPFYQTKQIVCEMLDLMAETLQGGDDIILRGFGTFRIKTKAPKSVRDISKGVQYTIAARKRVVFDPGKELKNI